MTECTSYTIVFERFCIDLSIGIHDFEKLKKQSYCLDIRVEFDVDITQCGDDIHQYFDYDTLYQHIHTLAKETHFETQEHFCLSIGRWITQQKMVRSAQIFGYKNSIFNDVDKVGVEIIVKPSSK